MSKVQVLGPRRLLPDVLRFIQDRGVLELRSPPTSAVGAAQTGGVPLLRAVPLDREQLSLERALEDVIRLIDEVLASLPPAAQGPEPASLPPVPSPELVDRLEALHSELRSLAERREALRREQEAIARYERLLMALSPLKPVPTTGAYSVGLIMAPQALPILEREVSRVTSGVYDLRSRPVDEEHVGALLTVPRALDRQVGVLLAEIGVEEVTLPAPEKGQPYHRSLLRMLERGREIPGDIAAVENRIGDLGARWGPALHAARRGAEDRLGEIRAMARCGETEHAFVLTGYLPREQVPQLSNAVNEAFRGQVAVLGSAPLREEYGEVPVVLRNPRLLKPFELLLSLVPLPRYGSIDPTPLLAVFYPLFFGLIIGDAGFGVIALALASLAHRRRWGGRMGRQMASVALACAISTLIFGFLYGEIFGLGSQIGLHPILLDRRRAFMTFLVAAVVLGGAHVAMGLVLGFFDSARNRRLREAITRAAQLTLLLCIAALLVVRLGALPSSMHDWTLAALAASAVVGVAAGGPMLLLEVLMSVGNVLSYARLMALGLASVLLAEAANRVATAVKPAAIALFIAVILHLTNFTLGLISPIVNALRLHYVEFFEKFYEPGGRPYRPFALSA